MLAIPGKNPMGNVLHLVIGPESELVMDMQGSAVMDITPVINKFDAAHPVFVSLSRSRNEITTSNALKQAGVSHLGFMATPAPDGCSGDCEHCNVDHGSSGGTYAVGGNFKQGKKPGKSEVKNETCAYCKKPGQLLPVPGFKICVSCAQIELGLNAKSRKGDTALTKDKGKDAKSQTT